MRTWIFLASIALYAATEAAEGTIQGPRDRFVLTEVFGVSHPDQIIDFDPGQAVDPRSKRMLGPDGQEVPYQILSSGHIAIRTDLPAGASREWKLVDGAPAGQFPETVHISKSETFYEITNGLTGVRVPLTVSDLAFTPGPIQGICYRGGTWTAAGAALSANARKMDVRFIEQGLLKVVVEVSYVLDRPALTDGEKVVLPAGNGFYKSTIELQAGQPSILMKEEADTDVSYSLNLFAGLRPTQARYRGHGSTDVKYGRTAGGQVYPGGGLSDGFVDLTYDQSKESGSASTETSWRRISAWEPWAKNGGWYWMMYDAGASDSANVAGIFAGPASQAIGASYSGVGIFTRPKEGGDAAAGVTITCARRGTDARQFPRTRFAWGLFVGSKGQSLHPPEQVQPIGRQWNLHAGFNLNKIHRIEVDYPDPPSGYGGLFMNPAIQRRMQERLRLVDKTGDPDNGYRRWLLDADPHASDLVHMWADESDAPVKAAVAGIETTAREFLDAMVNGGGIFHSSGDQLRPSYAYWMGALEMGRKGIWIDQVLASDRLTPQERSKVKAVAALFAHAVWDDDYAPLFEGHGLHLGNPNMPVLHQGMRNFFALFLAEHPAMRPRISEVEQIALRDLRKIVNEHGAEMSSGNYISAAFAPTLRTFDAQGARAAGKQELPSTGPVFDIAPGVNRLSFQGQWLIDWDLYLLADEPQQALIGNWGHYWHPGPEQAEFEKAQGRPFEERQHILRVHGSKGFNAIILPFRKGEPREDVRVEQTSEGVRVFQGNMEAIIGEHYYAAKSDEQTVIATLDAKKAEVRGVAIEGGPVEVTLQSGKAIVAVHGAAGIRRITLPGPYQIDEADKNVEPPTSQRASWIVSYPGGKPATFTFRSLP